MGTKTTAYLFLRKHLEANVRLMLQGTMLGLLSMLAVVGGFQPLWGNAHARLVEMETSQEEFSTTDDVVGEVGFEVTMPEVKDIKVTNKKPVIFGTAQSGATVFGHFVSGAAVSSIVTTTGDFVLTPEFALETGSHIVRLYTVIPSGAKSTESSVPFEITEQENAILNPAMFKADITGAGATSMWWLLGALLPLLLLAAILVYMLLNKTDTVVYSLTPKQLKDVEGHTVGQLFRFRSGLPVTKADLITSYIAFYLYKGQRSEPVQFKYFGKLKEGTLGIVARIIEETFIIERDNGNVELTREQVDMDDFPRYKIDYVFEIISLQARPMANFAGKKYALAKDLMRERHTVMVDVDEHVDTV